MISFYASAQNEVIYLWSGAITPSSAKVNAKLTSYTSSARLVVSTTPDLLSPLFGPTGIADASNNKMAALTISGLRANTTYYYGVESDGVLDNSPDDIGKFRTSAPRPYTFRFLASSCGKNSAHLVYTKMAEKNPLILIECGDFHYANPNSATNIDEHRLPYEENMLSKTASRNFLLNYPFAYIWDDHDFSGNNSDSLAVGRTNARLAYREYVPHYPLPAGPGDQPIYQAFTIGRIYFIMTDLRSVRGVGDVLSTDPNLSIMGTIQKDWFKKQCLYARDRNLVIAWVSSVTFGGDRPDNWGGFRAEREELSNFFKASAIKNMFIISGDSHMLALDNGTNHDFTTLGDNPNKYPVFPAAALNQNGSNKGGTYSEGKFTNPDLSYGQYGMIDVTDVGGSQVTITFNGFRVDSLGAETVLLSNKSFVMTTGVILPVKFSSFSVQQFSSSNKLIWKAEELDDCNHFVIEKSSNGIDFNKIGELNCSAHKGVQVYSFTDEKPVPGNNYYRVKVVNEDGTAIYTSIKKIEVTDKQKVLFLDNPVKGQLLVQFVKPMKEKTQFNVLNIVGQLIVKGWISTGASSLTISAKELKHGTYLLQIYGNTYKQTCKFIVQ